MTINKQAIENGVLSVGGTMIVFSAVVAISPFAGAAAITSTLAIVGGSMIGGIMIVSGASVAAFNGIEYLRNK